jgi:hypothetical protein
MNCRFLGTVALAFLAIHVLDRSLAFGDLVTNGSFESGTYVLDQFGDAQEGVGSTAIAGWTFVSNTVGVLGTPNYGGLVPEDGNVLVDLSISQSPFGGVSQSIATAPGVQYDMTFWLGVQNTAMGPVSVTASRRFPNRHHCLC